MREIDELRPLTAGRLLTLWRENQAEEPLERAILCNAQVLAESCFFQGEPVFENASAVLGEMTGQQMERLLRQMTEGGRTGAVVENPAFDLDRFRRLQEE